MKLSEIGSSIKFTSGKYAGRLIKDIEATDPDYLIWRFENMRDHGGILQAQYNRCLKASLRDNERDVEPVKATASENERVTYYADGSGTRHGGGPCGDLYFDKFGNT